MAVSKANLRVATKLPHQRKVQIIFLKIHHVVPFAL